MLRQPPKNIKHRPSQLDPEVWRDRMHRTKTWVIHKTPEPVRQAMPAPERVRQAVRAFSWTMGLLYAVLVIYSLGGAYVREGGVRDRRNELRRAEAQLAEERARTELLRSRAEGLERREDVRVDAIRRELNRLRQGERFYVFK
ncbi:MAG: hypothetical protein H6747_10110 [Deltaproteobacteria bacterium]|nr:hypothetical protein [Deltaproteobacteria bacterium]